jgi:serine/threonine-protein kinase RsbT
MRIPVITPETISVGASGDIVGVRHAVRRQAVKINLSLVDQTKIVTAASELARNMLVYGGGGEVTLEVLEQGIRRGLRVHFADSGQESPILSWRCGTDSLRGMEWDLASGARNASLMSFILSPQSAKAPALRLSAGNKRP